MAWLMKKQRSRASKEAEAVVADVERQLTEAGLARIVSMSRTVSHLDKDWRRDLERDMAFVVETTEARAAIKAERKVRRDVAAEARLEERLKFQVSCRFLRECWMYLAGDPEGRERLHLVSGPVTPEGVRILSQREMVTFTEQSAAFVSASALDTHKRLIELDRDGHEMLAMFHSHIMRGKESTRPSNIDIQEQNRFVKFGLDTIGGIFSLDGYVRLFGTGKEFDVALFGKGADVVERKPKETIIKLRE